MKNFLFLAIAFFSFQLVDAQEQISPPQDRIYQMDEVNIKPEYPGGTKAFYQFVAKKFLAPEKAGINGKIILTFVIEKDGSINEIKVLQDVGYGSGEEAARVIKKSEKWISAQKEGNPVRVFFKLPITINTAK